MKLAGSGALMILGALGIGLAITKKTRASGGGLLPGKTYSFVLVTDDMQVDADSVSAILAPNGWNPVASITEMADGGGKVWAATAVWTGKPGPTKFNGFAIKSIQEGQV